MYYVVVMAYAWHYAAASFGMAWTKPTAFLHVENDEAGLPKTAAEVPADRIRLYLDAPNESAKQRLEELEAGKLEGRRLPVLTPPEVEQRLRVERAKDPAERIHYVSLSQNVSHYFDQKCLGGFHASIWFLDGQIRALEQAPEDETPEEADQRLARKRQFEAVLAAHRGERFKLSPNLVIGALVTWLLIFLIIFRGVKNVGRVVMFTVPLPVILLLVLLVRGITLPGATEGILYYLKPNWEMLKSAKVWIAAYSQIFFSLSLGFGILIAYASYMPRESDVTNSAFITSFGNCATSFLGGLAVFSVLGYLAHMQGTEVGKLEGIGGFGLAFQTYPVALAQMPGPKALIAILSLLFFLCLITLGIDSAFSLVEGMVAGFRDRFPGLSRPLMTAVLCLIGFGGSLFVCTRSGLVWLDILDHWTNQYGLVLVGLLECVAVGYFFNLDELKDYINEHSEVKVHYWFDLFIKFVTPAILIYLLAAQFLQDITQPYGGYDQFMEHAVDIAGWGVFAVLLVLAFILGRNWRTLAWAVAGLAVFGAFFAYFSLALPDRKPAELMAPAIMGAVGAVLLFGGLITAIHIACKTRHMAGPSLEAGTPPPDKDAQ